MCTLCSSRNKNVGTGATLPKRPCLILYSYIIVVLVDFSFKSITVYYSLTEAVEHVNSYDILPVKETTCQRCCLPPWSEVQAQCPLPGAPMCHPLLQEGCQSHSEHIYKCPCGNKYSERSSPQGSRLCVCWWFALES